METISYSKLKKSELLVLLEQRDNSIQQSGLVKTSTSLDCENTNYSGFIKEDLLALVNESCVTISNLTAENEKLQNDIETLSVKLEKLDDEVIYLKEWKLARRNFMERLYESKTFNFFNRIFKWDTTWL
jgi:hypothetical protein